MREPFRLAVLTPERTLLEAEGVTQVQARLVDGGPIGIYPGHAPLLAEMVAAPLRYVDAAGEHVIDLGAGILQVSNGDVTVFADGAKPCEGSEPPQGSQNDQHFDRLAHELLAKLNVQPDEVLNTEEGAATMSHRGTFNDENASPPPTPPTGGGEHSIPPIEG